MFGVLVIALVVVMVVSAGHHSGSGISTPVPSSSPDNGGANQPVTYSPVSPLPTKVCLCISDTQSKMLFDRSALIYYINMRIFVCKKVS